MALKLSHLAQARKTCAVPVSFEDGEGNPVTGELNVAYNPRSITPEMEDKIQRALEEKRQLTWLAETLAALVIEWDLLDDEGRPMPASVEVMKGMPAAVLNDIFQAVMGDMRPPQASDEG